MNTNFDQIKLFKKVQPLKTGKAKGWGGIFAYHWVELAITEENRYTDHLEEPIKWCKENLGISGTRWFEKQGKFYFKEEKDLTIFVLRWS